jgi:hypothetical protein
MVILFFKHSSSDLREFGFAYPLPAHNSRSSVDVKQFQLEISLDDKKRKRRDALHSPKGKIPLDPAYKSGKEGKKST